ncbi:unnamed protein product [Brassica oleracea var. botrytis]
MVQGAFNQLSYAYVPYLRSCKASARDLHLLCQAPTETVFSTSVYKPCLSAPDPIKLTFTSAYKRFLISLDLDG